MKQTDIVLAELFVSRRWKLANAIGSVLQVLGRPRVPTAEDRLRELKGEFRAWLQESGRDSSRGG